MLEHEDGRENPLPTLQEFGELQAGLREWTAAPPRPEPLAVVASSCG